MVDGIWVTPELDSNQGIEIKCEIDKTTNLGLVAVVVCKYLKTNEISLASIHGTDAGAQVD